MSNIKRLKVTFIDKDTMEKVSSLHRIIVHVDIRTSELKAELYDSSSTEPKELEIRVEEEL